MSDTTDDPAGWARGWLLDAAFPLWWDAGADRERGGFHELIGQDGRPVEAPKRMRVHARMVYAYAQARRLGWTGPWREAIEHGLDFLETAYRRDDGFYRTLVAGGGRPGSDAVVLYDQAFVLLALAHAYDALGRPQELLVRAHGLLDRLEERLGHPLGGFEEARPRTLPLRTNPHMHLFEAMLAWTELHAEPRFAAKAHEIATLATTRLIDSARGQIGEYYDGDWRPAEGEAGQLREPGHHYEWAFLLHEADRLLGTATAPLSERLLRFAERSVRSGRVLFSVTPDAVPIDGSARLWAQIERLRALHVLDGDPAAVAESAALLRRFLAVPVRGLWTDRISADGDMVDEPAPASTFYHVVSGTLPFLLP